MHIIYAFLAIFDLKKKQHSVFLHIINIIMLIVVHFNQIKDSFFYELLIFLYLPPLNLSNGYEFGKIHCQCKGIQHDNVKTAKRFILKIQCTTMKSQLDQKQFAFANSIEPG